VTAADAFRPDQWRDFFIMVGGAAAVLTGLVFVAMSLNVTVIILLVFMISGAWLLIVGVSTQQPDERSRFPQRSPTGHAVEEREQIDRVASR
jgi:Flp pilus assembly protein TadB